MNWGRLNHWWITLLVRRSIRQNLRRSLAGVWLYGRVPRGAALLAPNHASWWDGYLLAELGWACLHPFQIMMTDAQLARFPFLRLIGARGQREVRSLRRGLRAGEWAVVFPAGEIRHPAALLPLHPGAAWLAGREHVALFPVAVRVVLRGSQWPEAFLRLGEPCAPNELESALAAVLAQLEEDLKTVPADQPPPGYLCLLRGRASRHNRVDWPSRMLAWLGGTRSRG
ncbi:1-acyl-sn-glycerol-3-phosphate acyltransferase [Deinococcus sp.]|uniref:lysophospholipid acyltransferase family protein n=1 Tax=Deinococcus sp. TaxID=47478 RepID=UPI0025B8AF41|nr:lysophospholipid acyltransferase family protein [Deinococcus sp.]